MLQLRPRNNRTLDLAATLLVLVPSSGQAQNGAEAPANPPAAVSSLDADLQNTLTADRKTFRGGTPIPKGAGVARYQFDKEGRIVAMYLPSAVRLFRDPRNDGNLIKAATGISYGHSDEGVEYVTSLTLILSDGRERTYTRDKPHPEGSFWSFRGLDPLESRVNSSGKFSGNFRISDHGDLAITELFEGPIDDLLVGPDGKIHKSRFDPRGSTHYTDGQNRLCGVRRSNGLLLTCEYQDGFLSRVTDTAREGTKTTWQFSSKERMWVCSDPIGAPSKESPLLPRGAMAFKTRDGLWVGIAITGSKTLLFPNGTQTLIDKSGRVTRVANGARSRRFIYDEDGGLVGYREMIGSKVVGESKVPQRSNIGYVVTDLGRIDTFECNKKVGAHPDQVPLTCFAEAPSFSRQKNEVAELPPMLAHIHPTASSLGCLAKVCPPVDISRRSGDALLPTSVPAFGVTSDVAPKVFSVHSLSDIATKRGDILEPFVAFLRVWARTTTDEDIDAVTCPEFLAQFKGPDSDAWISSELGGVDTADFLVWLRDCVNRGQLPCSLDIKPLDRVAVAGVKGASKLIKGVTSVTNSSMSGAIHVEVELQSRDLSKQQLMGDLKRLLAHGGIGLLSPGRDANEAPFWALFHELVHACDHVHGVERKSFEPAAHIGALSALLTITKAKAGAYRDIFPDLVR